MSGTTSPTGPEKARQSGAGTSYHLFALRQELTGSVALVALTLWLRGAVPNQERPMTRVPPIAGSSPSQNGLLCVPQCMNAAEPPAAPNGGGARVVPFPRRHIQERAGSGGDARTVPPPGADSRGRENP